MKDTINSIDRIKINLLELKPRKALEGVHNFYKKNMRKYFNENGNPNKAHFKEVKCPICSGNRYNHKIIIDFFEYRECKCCKSIYNSPRLKAKILDLMYRTGEYTKYFNKLTVSSQTLRKNVIEARKFRQVSSFFHNPGRILDIGCGTGSFIKVCQENSWEVYGVDPSESAARIAKEKYGLKIEKNTFGSFKTEKQFDCITFWGQLEHSPDPMKAIEKAVGLLKEGGIIAFEVPSADSFLMKYLVNNKFSPYRYIENSRHIVFFSRVSIHKICSTFDLTLAYLESNGLDLQTILLHEFDNKIIEKLLSIQQVIDELALGDHYRVFLRRKGNEETV